MKHAAAVAAVIILALSAPSQLAWAGSETSPEPATAQESGKNGTAEPRQKYDSIEVIRHVKDVDRSRVINSTTIVPFIRGPVVHIPIVTRVNVVVHRYEVAEVPYGYTYQRKIYVKRCGRGSRSYWAPSCG